jgi:predicted Zn-dependent peptidase
MQMALYDLPPDYYMQFVPRIERITTDDISRVMSSHIDPSRLTTLIVGDLDTIGDGLGRLGLGDPVVVAHDSF